MGRSKNSQTPQEEFYSPLISPVAPASSGSHKMASVLSRQLTAYEAPMDKQGKIFDVLQKETRDEIPQEQAQGIAVGLDCSPAERKLIEALCILLHQKSQTREHKEEGYYLGNSAKEDRKLVAYGSLGQIEAPTLVLSVYEITKYYSETGGIGGKNQQNVLEVLQGLADKKFLIRYERTTKIEGAAKGQPAKKKMIVEQFGPIIHIITEEHRTYAEDDTLLETTGKQLKVVLSPLFRDQIDSQFLLRPNDIIQRTALAHGSQNIPEATYRLRDWILEQIHHCRAKNPPKDYTIINQERALWRVAAKTMKQNRRKRAQEQLDKALDTAKKIGLLISWELAPSAATSEMQYKLFLNLDFQ